MDRVKDIKNTVADVTQAVENMKGGYIDDIFHGLQSILGGIDRVQNDVAIGVDTITTGASRVENNVNNIGKADENQSDRLTSNLSNALTDAYTAYNSVSGVNNTVESFEKEMNHRAEKNDNSSASKRDAASQERDKKAPDQSENGGSISLDTKTPKFKIGKVKNPSSGSDGRGVTSPSGGLNAKGIAVDITIDIAAPAKGESPSVSPVETETPSEAPVEGKVLPVAPVKGKLPLVAPTLTPVKPGVPVKVSPRLMPAKPVAPISVAPQKAPVLVPTKVGAGTQIKRPVLGAR
jgi:uncharacterized protein YoxC